MTTEDATATPTTSRGRGLLYWGSTGFATLALAAVGSADLFRVPTVIEGLAHLGYPAYFATILGAWKLLGVAAILAPGLPRLKEWAYAGFFFTLTGAALSHAISGDPIPKICVPLVVLGFVLASRALLPARQTAVIVPRAAPQGGRTRTETR
jgi:uncharacterized membrane protein YphA (DoxX/SURF4 family)